MGPRDLLGMRIKELRLAAGLTSRELGEKAGVSKATINGLENAVPVSIETLNLIARALDVTLESLLKDITNPEGLPIVLPKDRPRRKRGSHNPDSHEDCSFSVCRSQLAPALADFLGHDTLGHNALKALITFADVRTPVDMKRLTPKQLNCLTGAGAKTVRRIRERMTATVRVDPSPDISPVISELIEGDRVYNVRRTLDGFNATVSPDGEKWYEVKITMEVEEGEAPKTFHLWDKDKH